jgi:hypothetical protein
MKTSALSTLSFFLFISLFASAQNMKQPFPVTTTMTAEQEFSKKYLMYFDQYSAVVNGQRVMGIPFLYHEWFNGTITTADGRLFNGYKLKYDIFSQAVHFLSGKDSLEVNDEIKDFVLQVAEGETVTPLKFVNANNYKKEKTIFYYQVLIDEQKGQLLKANKKIVAEMSSGLPAYEGQKYFKEEFVYYYYDKTSQKISKVKADGSNLPALLQLSSDRAKQLELLMGNSGGDLITMLKPYFQN